ncbi:MAG: YicC family protein [Deltaproteobacteria bacterium]|nr:MAG: YicC family protein [Deltaproteobacteria bacterium]
MRSMTGYGAASAEAGGVRLTAEVRSVNHRHLDVKVSAPREYAPWEADIRKAVGARLGRGRVEVSLTRAAERGPARVVVRQEVAEHYVRAMRDLKRRFSLEGDVDLGLIASRHDVFESVERKSDRRRERELLDRVLDRALAAHVRERTREGMHLRRDMERRVRVLARLRREMVRAARRVGPRMRERMQARLEEVLGADVIDPARLVHEVAIQVDRCDVTEELVRLESHLLSLGGLLREDGPVGKRIEFLLQEVHREVNTIGSKAGDLDLTRLVLDAKAELEKLREQVQNVE